ncbi:hypothetical protein SPRG_03135 [Saprolegnia parasitica CBS 223.65]|uniref:Uncharacterized protein n=1 Tax=Saprolegnia parasitica (strain CBS 223.65) TaxID=695850 RepID=A0A067CMI6_SAPPC|nr:hypothetical protein SPRG_03135 [Saprolegnia parasitica CBS 223.65]KDO31919.1 hypothetical protein SPRG_03135 [Saprolegnia parasitica CBS 223.65]|eukprot:XP_012197118.1 hypothetical protein SPRG_03135 [Saprolegnia parasitica CBS 223.65]
MLARIASKRAFTASARRLAGDHHPHTVFHDKSFTRKNVGGFVWTLILGGTVATLGICQFQNYKGGFPQQKPVDDLFRHDAAGRA